MARSGMSATPFDQFLSSVRSQEAQWKSRFANAAIDADALTRDARAEGTAPDPGHRRRPLPRLGLGSPVYREAGRRGARAARAARHLPRRPGAMCPRNTGRRTAGWRRQRSSFSTKVTSPLGGWVERPSELHMWVIANKARLSSEELRAKIQKLVRRRRRPEYRARDRRAPRDSVRQKGSKCTDSF